MLSIPDLTPGASWSSLVRIKHPVEVMETLNILEAKSSLSKLVAAVENGEAEEIIIARNGKPVARLVPLEVHPPIRLGLLKGKYTAPKDLDAANAEVLEMFGVDARA